MKTLLVVLTLSLCACANEKVDSLDVGVQEGIKKAKITESVGAVGISGRRVGTTFNLTTRKLGQSGVDSEG